ncbi:MAG: S-methyl-5-thioribose-1-phosphate isomerase [Ignavibacteriae bacterium]|nr:S-methyl-5-thioribose-1-phosphate isomerase [Ignavibacteria bacterium]MBI3365460.1 S-methyl-5-thioribose-1-phosphate isomerase [Ignavibacteriota bacterium]
MKSIEWLGNRLRFIDQTKLPLEEVCIETDQYTLLADAIRSLGIRGAPLIGVAAAYGVALAGLRTDESNLQSFRNEIEYAIGELASTRPTAVNLSWALERMRKNLNASLSIEAARVVLVREAIVIHEEDEEMCRRIGECGSQLIPDRATILTHCNAGALATGGEGTALNIITTAHRMGKSINVYVSETRPLLQGARLTTWELMKAGVDVTLIIDSAAASLMQQKKIDCVVVGADRIARNGDAANKVGTYMHAVTAHYHGIPFYVAAPSSSIDPPLEDGNNIPIEERNASEITEGFGKRIAPEGTNVYAPAFDSTPARLITAIVTEKGIHRPPFHFQ